METFALYRDMIMPVFMYLNLFILSTWKYKQKTMVVIGLCVTAGHLVIVHLAWMTFSVTIYAALRSAVQLVLFLLALLLMEERGAKTFIPVITASSVVTVFSIMTSILLRVINSLHVAIAVCILLHSVGVLISVFVLRPPLREMTRFLKKGVWTIGLCIAIPVIVFTLLGASPNSMTATPQQLLPSVGMTVIMVINHVVVFALYRTIRNQSLAQEERHVMEVQLGATKVQIEKTEESQKQIQVLTHDIRHYANLIAVRLQSGDSKGAMEVNAAMLKQIDDVGASTTHYCDNVSLNLLLNYYSERAQKSGCEMQVKVLQSGGLPCEEIELAVMLSNCIENAVNAIACIPAENEKRLSVILRFEREQFFAEICNSFVGDVKINPSTGLPTTDEPDHGTGMFSINSVVRKHKGFLRCSTENGVFFLRIMLPVEI